MRIGIYTSAMAVRPGYEEIVSGHVQIPLYSARLLIEAGHDVHLITTEHTQERVLPEFVPPKATIHRVADMSSRRTAVNHDNARGITARVHNTFRAARQVRELARTHELDLLHFFGGTGTAQFGGLTRLLGTPCPVLATMNVGPYPSTRIRYTRPLWRQLDGVLTSTEYFRQRLADQGIEAGLVRHGIVRDIRRRAVSGTPRNRVLFWREASPLNGGDIGVEVFRTLAPRYPDIRFDFAIRPHRHQPAEVEQMAATMPNVRVYTTPYPTGISLNDLLAETICVLQPFRLFTLQPQFSILESMAAGVPTIASDIESASEIIRSGEDGVLVPTEDAPASASAVEAMILNPEWATTMGDRAHRSVASKWNWDTYYSDLIAHYRKAGA